MNETLIQVTFIGDRSENYLYQAIITTVDGIYGYGYTPKEAAENLLEQFGDDLE